MACVDIPALPLQLLVRNHPDWSDGPVAVVDRDKPQGIIQHVNERARACHILPGMRYAAGLSLSNRLHAGVVPEILIAQEVIRLQKRLSCFSPTIEPAAQEPGVFWIDASGLLCLYASLEAWAASLKEDLRRAGYTSVVAVGFTRFGSYAAAKANSDNIVFYCPDQEQVQLRKVSIECLGIDPNLRYTLRRLGIYTLGHFMDLPTAEIHRRLGSQAHQLHELAHGNGWTRIRPHVLIEPVERIVEWDYPETCLERMLSRIEPSLQSILTELAERYELCASLSLSLQLDDGCRQSGRVLPATPTGDKKQLLSLLGIKIQAFALSSGVAELRMCAVGSSVLRRQRRLFGEGSRRNPQAVYQAFAALRTEIGDDAVVQARLQEGHLPEAGFGWEPFERLVIPKPKTVALRPLVRRIGSRPVALPGNAGDDPRGWHIAGVDEGPIHEVIGPHILSGSWWAREISRVYYYVRTRSGRWLWIYNDQKRGRWFLQGSVE